MDCEEDGRAAIQSQDQRGSRTRGRFLSGEIWTVSFSVPSGWRDRVSPGIKRDNLLNCDDGEGAVFRDKTRNVKRRDHKVGASPCDV